MAVLRSPASSPIVLSRRVFDGESHSPADDDADLAVAAARAPPEPASGDKTSEQYFAASDPSLHHAGLDSTPGLARLNRGLDRFLAPPSPRAGDPLGAAAAAPRDPSLARRVFADLTARFREAPRRRALADKIGAAAKDVAAAGSRLREDVASRDAVRTALAARDQALASVQDRLDQDMDRIHVADSQGLAVKDYQYVVNVIQSADVVEGQMLAFLDQRRQAILQSMAQNQQAGQAATAGAATLPQMNQDNLKTLSDDKSLAQSVQMDETEARLAAQTVPPFQVGVKGLIDAINAADKKNSPDAKTEYQRRLALIQSGAAANDPSSPISPAQIQSYQDLLDQNLKTASDGLSQIQTQIPIEDVGAIIDYAPGPAQPLRNAGPGAILSLLSDRKSYWQGQEQPFLDAQKTLTDLTNPDNSALASPDAFGDRNPQSLIYWQNSARTAAAAARTAADGFLAQLDAAAQTVNAAGGHLPMLEPKLQGGSLTDLQNALQAYPDQLKAAVSAFPADNGDLNVFKGKMALIAAALYLPLAGNQVIALSYNQGIVDSIEGVKPSLQTVQTELAKVLGIFSDIQADVAADQAFVGSIPSGGKISRAQETALLARKEALLSDKIIAPLTDAKSVLFPALNSLQSQSSAGAAPGGTLQQLYQAKLDLINGTVDLYDHQLAWALASFGGSYGDQAGSQKALDAWKKTLTDNLDLVNKNLKDVQDRDAVGISRTETIAGEVQPYSLADKETVYSKKLSDNLAVINQLDPQVNAILQRAQSASDGAVSFQGLFLPVPAGANDLDSLRVLLPNLIAKLQALEAQAPSATTVSGVGAGVGRVPTGVQPSPTVSPAVQASLVELEALKRLLPGDAPGPLTLAVVHAIYDQQVVQAAQDAKPLVAKALAALPPLADTLNAALADTANDQAFLGGGGESPTALYARKTALFQRLDNSLIPILSLLDLKQSSDQSSIATTSQLQTYFDSLKQIYDGGTQVGNGELQALDATRSAVVAAFKDLDKTRDQLKSWLSQLNPREDSAFNRMAAAHAGLLDDLLAAAREQKPRHALRDQDEAWEQIIRADAALLRRKQRALAALRAQPGAEEFLSEAQRKGLDALGAAGGITALADERGQPAAFLVPKSQLPGFLDLMWDQFHGAAAGLSGANWASLKQGLLRDPGALSSAFPGLDALTLGGGGPDEMRLIYRSRFSVPHGLETGSRATVQNLLRLGRDAALSLSGYHFAVPPSPDGAQPAYGDGGVELRLHHAGASSYEYLVADVHRPAGAIPGSNTVAANFGETRLYLLAGAAAVLGPDDNLTFGGVGYGDFALSHPEQKVSFYGGDAKLSVRLNRTIHLTAEQRELFVKDPRRFLETVNFSDFSAGFDQSLNRDFVISAHGQDSRYSYGRYGARFDLAGAKDPLTLDLFYSSTHGTDDISQGAGGVAVLKGFSLQDKKGRDWFKFTGGLSAERGPQAGVYKGDAAFVLPGAGISLNGNGEIIGAKSAYYARLAKVVNENSTVSVDYGNPALGLKPRLGLNLDTSLSLRGLWEAVAGRAAQDLRGGAALKGFDEQLKKAAGEAAPAIERDLGRRLREQAMGLLGRDIADLLKAGAFLDNSHARARVGFTSKAPSNSAAELAAAGGPTAGLYTDATLTRAQKKLLALKVRSLYREGLLLQERVVELVQSWAEKAAALSRAQWERRLAERELEESPEGVLRAEARVRLEEARSREREAGLDYDAFLGRDAASPPPALGRADLETLLGQVQGFFGDSGPLSAALKRLDEKELAAKTGRPGFNVLDWLPWVESLTAGVGVQLQDSLSGQAFTAGFTLRLPVYDPEGRAADKSYVLESKAELEELRGIRERRRLERELAAERARAAAGEASAAPDPAAARARLERARRVYLNGGGGLEELRRAEASWRLAELAAWDAAVRPRLAAARLAAASFFDGAAAPRADSGPAVLDTLAGAVARAESASRGLAAAGFRALALGEKARADAHRLRKATLELSAGTAVTTFGQGFVPSLPVTGLAVTPVLGLEFAPEDLRRLQASGDSSRVEQARALETLVRAGLAVRVYQAAMALRGASSPEEKASARAALNALLGRDPGAPLAASLDPAAGLAQLRDYLKAHDPVAARKSLLRARAEAARADEEIVFRGLRLQQLKTEPVSLALRGLGRLMSALSGGPAYDPRAAAQAFLRAREAESARDSFEARRRAGVAELRAELAACRDDSRAFALKAGLLALGADSLAPAAGTLPRDWSELDARLEEAGAAQAMATDGTSPGSDPSVAPREGPLTGGSRVYRATRTLGDEPVNTTYLEGWIEARLGDPRLGPEGALELARLREERESQVERARRAEGAARGRELAVRFQADLGFWRLRCAEGPRRGFESFCADLERRLRAERGRMGAWLDLPEASLGSLDALAESGAPPPADPRAEASRLIADLRARNLDSLERVLYGDGAAPAPADADPLELARADLVAARMGFDGFTPVLALGLFRGQTIAGAFLETPDPRELERGLENLLSRALRDRLQADGSLRELDRALRERILRVQDGLRALEARRLLVEAAESELRSRAALASADAGAPSAGADRALALAQRRLIAAWAELSRSAAAEKAAFASLVCEIEALRPDPAVLASLQAPALPPAGDSPAAAREALLDFWAERLGDPAFKAEQDRLLGALGKAAEPEDLSAVRGYREALRRAAAARRRLAGSGRRAALTAALESIDAGGRRLALRARLARLFDRLGGLRGADRVLQVLRSEAQALSETPGRAEAVLPPVLNAPAWRAARPSAAQAAAFRRLDVLAARLAQAHRALEAAYLSRGRDADRFLVADPALDAALRAESRFDGEILRDLRGAFAGDRRMIRVLDRLYGARAAVERERVKAWRGRGMAALNLLIRLARARLGESRRLALSPEAVAADARRLEDLRETRARWVAGAARKDAGHVAAGGADAAWARQLALSRKIEENERAAALDAELKEHDLAAADGSARWTVREAFGPGGLMERGLLRFYALLPGGGRRPLGLPEALSTPPDRMLIEERGPSGPRAVLLSSRGAARLADYLRRRREAEERLGWAAVKQNVYGFARAGAEEPVRLYATRAEFEAERRAFDRAPRALARAEAALTRACEEAGRRDREDDAARKRLEAAAEAARRQPKDSKARNPKVLRELARAGAAAREAARRRRLADARRVNAEEERASARAALEHSRSWTLYRSDRLVLSLDASGSIVHVAAPADRRPTGARDPGDLDVAIGGAGPAVNQASGAWAALAVDGDGRVRGGWASRAAAEKASAGWTREAYDADGETGAVLPDGRVRVKARLAGYEAPLGGEAVPVLLSRRFLQRRLQRARAALGAGKRWALAHWPELLLEPVRGVTDVPAELLAGRDPSQEGVLGGLALYKGEGGELERQGLLRRLLGLLDFFDLFPRRVETFFDPSQFPDAVRVSSPLKPGEILADKSPRDPADGRDVRFGRLAMARELRDASEDAAAARGLARAHFYGGIEERVTASRPGRAGEYPETRRLVRAPRPGDADGESSARPGSPFIARVRRWVLYHPGAEGFLRWLKSLAGFADRAAAREGEAESRRPMLRAEKSRADEALRLSLARIRRLK